MTTGSHHQHHYLLAPPDEAFPDLSPLVDASHLAYTATGHDFTDAALSLAFVTDHSTFDPSVSSFVDIGSATDPSTDTLDDFELRSFAPVDATPRLSSSTARRIHRADLPRSSSPTHHGTGQANPGPWSAIAVTGQPMTEHTDHHDVGAKHPRPSARPFTDSGYDSSCQSALLMQGHAHPAGPQGQQHYLDNESLEARVRQTLPDKQIPVSTASAQPSPTSGPRPRSSVTSLPIQDGTGTGTGTGTGSFFCSLCETPFTTHSEHQKHMARHERKHLCTYPGCSREEGFATSNDLERHRKGVHKEVGLEDPVWKCFFDGCRSADKIWTRLDNFIAHIKRMHPDAHSDEYVHRSDTWLESVEKPRRLREWHSQVPRIDLDPAPATDLFPYATTTPDHGYAASNLDLEDYDASVTEEMRDPLVARTWEAASLDLNPYAHSMDAYTPFQYRNTPDMSRSYSNHPNQSLSNVSQPAMQNDPPLALPYPDDEFMAAFHGSQVNMSAPIHAVGQPRARTLPDLDRVASYFMPDGANSFADPMTTFDGSMSEPHQESQNLLSYVGDNLNTTPNLNFNEGDVLSQGTAVGTNLSMMDPNSTVEQIAEQSDRDHQRDIALLLKRVQTKNPGLAKKLSEEIAKTYKEHSSSASAQVAHTGTRVAAGRSPELSSISTPFACTRTGCTARFAKKNRLTKHEKRHDRIFFCTFDGCFRRFGTKTDLSRHEYRVHHQSECWRCWSAKRHRGKNLECAELFFDEKDFEAHRKQHHSKGKRTLDDFKIDKDLAGAFWCGFCNEVVKNPEPVEVAGHKRVTYRYAHIDHHMNDIYYKSPKRNAMEDWHELAGNGKTKAEAKNAAHLDKKDESGDEDESEDDDDVDDVTPRTITSTSTTFVTAPDRPRSVIGTGTPRYAHHLQPQDAAAARSGLKRSADNFTVPGLPGLRPPKMPKLQMMGTGTGSGQPFQRSATNSRHPATALQPPQQRPMVGPSVAIIQCCRCTRYTSCLNAVAARCQSCTHSHCNQCKYSAREQKPMAVSVHRSKRNVT